MLTTEIREMLESVQISIIHRMSEQIANLKTEKFTPSPATHGSDQLKIIKDNNLTKDFEKVGDSVLTEDAFNSLQNVENEHSLIVEMTWRLQTIFSEWAVINSEKYPWLFTCNALRKPDLFICPVSFYTSRDPPNSRRKHYPPNFRYGTIEDQRLYDGVVLLDCKL
jgi:hypothetical protein